MRKFLAAVLVAAFLSLALSHGASARSIVFERGSFRRDVTHHLTVDLGKMTVSPGGLVGMLVMLFPPELQLEGTDIKGKAYVSMMLYTSLDDAVDYKFGLRPGFGIEVGDDRAYFRPAFELRYKRLEGRIGWNIGKGVDVLGRLKLVSAGSFDLYTGYYSSPRGATVTVGTGVRF